MPISKTYYSPRKKHVVRDVIELATGIGCVVVAIRMYVESDLPLFKRLFGNYSPLLLLLTGVVLIYFSSRHYLRAPKV